MSPQPPSDLDVGLADTDPDGDLNPLVKRQSVRS
jgi:hypothetical protein